MKCTKPFLFGAALAIAATTSFAQTGHPPTQGQLKDNVDTQNRMEQDGSDVTKRQKDYFQSLDREHKGYLNNDDVSADPLLTQNWGKCDADHDGKLTWKEFKMCTHNSPPPKAN